MFIRGGIVLVGLALAAAAAPRAHAECAGDCGGDGSVTVNELITGVNIALGAVPASQCVSFDGNGDGQVVVNELVSAVANALNGCPFTGQYTARIDVGDGETALIRLQVSLDGAATGTLSVAPAAALGRPALRLDIPLLNLVGTVDLDSGAFHLTGTVAGPDGDVPVDVSGTLPERPGLDGTLALQIGAESFSGPIAAGSGNPTPTATVTRPPVTPTPTPTSIPNNNLPTPPGSTCLRGSISVDFSNLSGTNSYVDLNQDLGLEKGSLVYVAQPGFSSFGGEFVPCSLNLGDIVRRVQLVVLNAQFGVPMPLGLGLGAPAFDYLETPSSNPLGTRGWSANGGSVIVDAIEGNVARFRIVDAVMVPEPSFSFQTPATGTFIINASARGELVPPAN